MSFHTFTNQVTKIIKNIDSLVINKEEPIYDTYHLLYTYKEGLMINEKWRVGDIIENGTVIGEVLNLDTLDKSDIVYKNK